MFDYNKPLATLLREGTLEAHDTVAMSPGAKLLLSGELDKQEYIRYLMMLWHVYESVYPSHGLNFSSQNECKTAHSSRLSTVTQHTPHWNLHIIPRC